MRGLGSRRTALGTATAAVTAFAMAIVFAPVVGADEEKAAQLHGADDLPEGYLDAPVPDPDEAPDPEVTTRAAGEIWRHNANGDGMQVDYRDRLTFTVPDENNPTDAGIQVASSHDGYIFRKRDGNDNVPDGAVYFTRKGRDQRERMIMAVGGNRRPAVTITNQFSSGSRYGQGLLVENRSPWSTVHFQNSAGGDVLFLQKKTGRGKFINAWDTDKGSVFSVDANGTTEVRVLKVHGADLAENFSVGTGEFETPERLRAGMVVSIDPENEGRMVLSEGSYDKRVAGVISGAGGLDVGMVLDAGPESRGKRPIALSGRVHVQCDASGGAIRPGDLLTTADRRGHCMRVADHGLAQGAILGKAMGRLEEGVGLVLALVTLQ